MADFSDPKGDFNPYAPPTAPDAPFSQGAGDDDELHISAERGTRWWARVIDNLLLIVTCVPAGLTFAESSSLLRSGRGVGSLSLSPLTYGLCLIPLALLCYQWFLITTRGQSLGKKWLGIKVIRMDGSPVGFVHGVLLREWILSLARIIPYAGSMIGLVDALMIFGEERRCMHDQIAGTRVVQTLGVG
jgi:uncharacterized RDD family membrane protein YckC